LNINDTAPDGDIWMDEVNQHLELDNGRPVAENVLPIEKSEKSQRDSSKYIYI